MTYRFERAEDPEGEGEEVCRSATAADAKERMLVLVALGIESWIVPLDEGFSLRVAESEAGAALRALADDAREGPKLVPAPEALALPGPWDRFWMVVAGLVLVGFHLLASANPELWRESGISDARRVTDSGAWFLAGTALTLHADFAHLAANLLFGGLFLWFLSPRLGPGVAWFLVFAGGWLGNLCNAFMYAPQPHRSLGASTAVFAALGILVGLEVIAVFRGGGWQPVRRVLVPVGAGLALLAWLGTEGERTDVLAHGWGFLAGSLLGLAVGAALRGRPPQRTAILAGLSVWTALVLCWMLALRGPGD